MRRAAVAARQYIVRNHSWVTEEECRVEDVLLQQPTVLMRPVENVISDLDSFRALIKAVTRQRLFRSNTPLPYSTRI